MPQGLMKLSSWVENTFDENSRPHQNTIYNWIKKGTLSVTKIGNCYYVKPQQFEMLNAEDLDTLDELFKQL